MQAIAPVLALVVGVGIGALGAWLVLRQAVLHASVSARAEAADKAARLEASNQALQAREAELNSRAQSLQAEVTSLTAKMAAAEARADEEARRAEEARKLLEDAEERLRDVFEATAQRALSQSSEDFLRLAAERLGAVQEAMKGVVDPIGQRLREMDEAVRALEAKREGAYGELRQYLEGVVKAEQELQSETNKLVRALRTPHVAGRWGEMQLRRVVEIANMLPKVDFVEQQHVEAEGGPLRPDMIIHLPGERLVVVDAKVPLQAYLDALEEETPEVREASLKEHARQVREHARKLGQKAYGDQFERSPEFVVMFIPREAYYLAALEADPNLIDFAGQQRVVIASPMSLLALLYAAAYGWRQAQIEESARQIAAEGAELYKRTSVLVGHWQNLGTSLTSAVGHYNAAVGSFERRLLPQARRMRELGAVSDAADDIPDLAPIQVATRTLAAPETQGSLELDSGQEEQYVDAPDAGDAGLYGTADSDGD